MNEYKYCQSCGMPLNADPNPNNGKFCSLCFKDGEFLNKDIKTAKEMQAFCIKEMKKQGMNGLLAWIFTRGIPMLERWKKGDTI